MATVQTLIVYVIVAAAAAWTLRSLVPWRAWRPRPANRPATKPRCGPDCGCGD